MYHVYTCICNFLKDFVKTTTFNNFNKKSSNKVKFDQKIRSHEPKGGQSCAEHLMNN